MIGRCGVIVYRERGPAYCGEAGVRIYKTEPMCAQHWTASVQPRRAIGLEQRFRDVLAMILDAPDLHATNEVP